MSKVIVNVADTADNIISLSEAKSYLRLSDGAEDIVVSLCVDSAISYVENYLGYPINDRQVVMTVSDYDGEPIPLQVPFSPSTIEDIVVEDKEGKTIESNVVMNNLGGYSIEVPDGSEFSIHYTVSPAISDRKHVIQAVFLLIGKFFEQRGDESKSFSEGGWETINRLLSLVSVVNI